MLVDIIVVNECTNIVFSVVRVVQSLVLCVVCCRSSLSFSPSFYWPLYYLPFQLITVYSCPFAIFKL